VIEDDTPPPTAAPVEPVKKLPPGARPLFGPATVVPKAQPKKAEEEPKPAGSGMLFMSFLHGLLLNFSCVQLLPLVLVVLVPEGRLLLVAALQALSPVVEAVPVLLRP